MRWTVSKTEIFDRQVRNIATRFNISRQETIEIYAEIEFAQSLLEEFGTLPDEYHFRLHELTMEPWKGRMEFHVADDILVVYAAVPRLKEIRFIGLCTHEMLELGKIDW
jgi:mRNA-degrading endonuclease YafQ of YafQ-DinJ toxin-antitoxin module